MHTLPHSRPAIQARGLRRTYLARSGQVEAVAGVDLIVEAGGIFGFLGPNGAGKTTVMRMLATLVPLTAGEAEVAGADLRREPRTVRRRIGYVGQRCGSDHSVSGRDELVFQSLLYGLSRVLAERRADELLSAFGLTDCSLRRTETYSGGQRRRLDVALGLVHQPTLLFLDEPTTGLDPQSRANLWEELRRLRDQGTTIFLTTHYLEEANVLRDQLAIIDRGRTVAQGTPDQLKRTVSGDGVTLRVRENPELALHTLDTLPYVRDAALDGDSIRLYVDCGEQAAPGLLAELSNAGLELVTLSFSRPTLDDVFLRYTGRSLRDRAA